MSEIEALMVNDNSRSGRHYRKVKKQFRDQCEKRGSICWLCGKPIDYTLKHPDPLSFSLDHRFMWHTHPHLRHDPANFEASHLRCNQRRPKSSKPKIEANVALGIVTREW